MKRLSSLLLFALLAATASARADDALYADLGGQAGIDRIVDASLDHYLADDRIKAIFDESNMDRLRAEFKVQFCQISGGPCQYTGHDMAAAPQGPAPDQPRFHRRG